VSLGWIAAGVETGLFVLLLASWAVLRCWHARSSSWETGKTTIDSDSPMKVGDNLQSEVTELS
jgi:hypothetical protein